MEQIAIPAQTVSWAQRVTLDGANYYLSVTLNEREDRYFFSLSDAQQTPLIEGRKILLNRNLLRGIAAVGEPPGALVAVDSSGTNRPPNYANLGTNVQLVYIEADELAGILA